jgi:hypothetical protein
VHPDVVGVVVVAPAVGPDQGLVGHEQPAERRGVAAGVGVGRLGAAPVGAPDVVARRIGVQPQQLVVVGFGAHRRAVSHPGPPVERP